VLRTALARLNETSHPRGPNLRRAKSVAAKLLVRIVVLAQDRYLVSRIPHALESHVLAGFDGTQCAGFLRYLVQVIGAEEGRPAVMHHDEPLLEGYVEALGVDPTAETHLLRRDRAYDAVRKHPLSYSARSPGGQVPRGVYLVMADPSFAVSGIQPP